MSVKTVTIAGRQIGPDHPPYVVAELSGNHNGELERALSLMEAAKAAGAEAVKLQTYTPDTITIDHDGPGFIVEHGLWRGRSLYELYGEAQTPWDWHEALFARGRELGLTVFSTPFDETAIDFLESLGAPAYKIASFEAIDLPLIQRAAATGKPMIISTGMADLGEIGEAVAVARDGGCRELVLLHCISGYPTPPSEANLRTISDLAARFDCVVGFSDHTMGTAIAVSAIALGATMIEKHVTLRRADGGPDSAFSLEPEEFATLSADCRTAWSALGHVSYERTDSERDNAIFRRSLYVVADMKEGDCFTHANVRSIRPGFGMPPKFLPSVLGRRATRAIARGTPLLPDLVSGVVEAVPLARG